MESRATPQVARFLTNRLRVPTVDIPQCPNTQAIAMTAPAMMMMTSVALMSELRPHPIGRRVDDAGEEG